MSQTCLPPGFRFHPTDVEFVSYYLKRKIMGKKLFVEAISEVELYKFAPWDLLINHKSCLQSKDLEWFFFCPHDKKNPKGSWTNRTTPNGYWKTSGKDGTIDLNSRIVGLKKTLIFHEGKAPKGNRTDWVMYEYKMEDETLVSTGFSKDAYVLSGLGPRIGEQYRAPFDGNEWENLDVGTYILSFAPSSGVEDSQVESSAWVTAIVIREPSAPQQSVQFSEHWT
ncbi:NAC domain-containing protein 82-like isoform X2 [Triticum urartu]|uniref:NAC domain-containing protein 82-like isoform X2 n=1 Tax=Triticum urartu TaxID=4572 RepID=UPI002043601F|nr:NAC domain-containing protein 82-like isoform X2 [Triticum urartu]